MRYKFVEIEKELLKFVKWQLLLKKVKVHFLDMVCIFDYTRYIFLVSFKSREKKF